MTTMADLRRIMTDPATAGDLDERIREIYRAGVRDGADNALRGECGDADRVWFVESAIVVAMEELR